MWHGSHRFNSYIYSFVLKKSTLPPRLETLEVVNLVAAKRVNLVAAKRVINSIDFVISFNLRIQMICIPFLLVQMICIGILHDSSFLFFLDG